MGTSQHKNNGPVHKVTASRPLAPVQNRVSAEANTS